MFLATLDPRTEAQAKEVVAFKQPGLPAAVARFNETRESLIKRRGKDGIAADAYVPEPLTTEGLYKMDVDSEIWLDVDMDDHHAFKDGKLPDWVTNVEVRRNIKFAQEITNCREELRRLGVEHQALARHWAAAYHAVNEACKGCSGKFLFLFLHQSPY